MDSGLSGKVALVTGASKGIGRGIAAALVAEGARVCLVSRKREGLEEAAAAIGGDTLVFPANAGEPDQAAAAVSACLSHFGALDVLVNNAAANPYMGPAIDIDLPRYDKTHQVNLRGPLVWTQAAWSAWMKEHGGNVINIASIGGLTFGGAIGIYDNTKAALIHLTGHLAVELAPGVRVNAIAPGLVKTDFARALWENPQTLAAVTMHTPLQRIGEPHEIAGAAVFLASPASTFVTGQAIVVDGGSTTGVGL